MRTLAPAAAGLLSEIVPTTSAAHAAAIDGNRCNPEAGYMDVRAPKS